MFNIVNRGDEYSGYDELDSQSFDTIEEAKFAILKDILNAQSESMGYYFDITTGKNSPITLDHIKSRIERGLWEKTIIEVVQPKYLDLDDYSDETIQAAFDKWMETNQKRIEERNKLNLEDKRRQLEQLKKELGEE
jgi:siroheme synthase (precorrin-2 oxidase/ferrochelatase)